MANFEFLIRWSTAVVSLNRIRLVPPPATTYVRVAAGPCSPTVLCLSVLRVVRWGHIAANNNNNSLNSIVLLSVMGAVGGALTAIQIKTNLHCPVKVFYARVERGGKGISTGTTEKETSNGTVTVKRLKKGTTTKP